MGFMESFGLNRKSQSAQDIDRKNPEDRILDKIDKKNGSKKEQGEKNVNEAEDNIRVLIKEDSKPSGDGALREPYVSSVNEGIKKYPETQGSRKNIEIENMERTEHKFPDNSFKGNPVRRKEYEDRRKAMKTREEKKGDPLLHGDEGVPHHDENRD